MEFFKNLKIVPRWLIILIDAVIIFHAAFFAYFVRFNFQLEAINRFEFLPSVIIFTVLAVMAMLISKSYVGIVRHTGTGDLTNMMKMLFVTNVLLWTIKQLNTAFELYDSTLFLPFSVALIASTLAFPLMIGYRLIVKEIFYYMNNRYKKPNRKVAIYGAGEAGILTFNALKSTSDSEWIPVAFIDDDIGKEGKLIEGKRIFYSVEGLKKAVEKLGVQEVVIAINSLSISRQREIIDACLDLGLPSKIIPPAKDWFETGLKSNDIRDVRIEDLLSREEINLGNNHVVDSIKGKIVLVTGAAGSIGSELSRQLLRCEPAQLLMLDQAESALYELEQELFKVNLGVSREALIGDVRNKKKMQEFFEKYRPEMVFHAAAYKHVPLMESFPDEAVKCNILGTKVIADLSHTYGVEKFVMVSTDKAVNPTNVMGASKRIAEMYVQALDKHLTQEDIPGHTKYITTRFGNVLGSNGSVIPLFKKQLMNGGPLTITHPEITRYFMTIPEACQLVLEAGVMGNGGEIYVFDMGKPVKILDLAKKMIKLSGKKLGEDIEIEFTGLRPGEKLFEELLNNYEVVKGTHHPKIKIAQVLSQEYVTVKDQVDAFEELLQIGDEEVLVSHLKILVPEFISNASRFSKLDKEDKLIN